MSESDTRTARSEWGSRFGYLMAMIGAMLGAGNIWRLPYVTGQHGGSAFLIALTILNFLIAVPGLMAESALGKYTGQGVIGAFRSVFSRGRAEGLGLAIVVINIALMSYYAVVIGWTIYYAIHSLLFTFSQPGFNSQQFWMSFLHSPLLTVGVFTLAIALVAGVLIFGIKDGIERMMSWVVPILVLVLVAVAVMGLTLEGGLKGIVFAFEPNWKYFTRSQTWIAALGQALFSTGLGWGIALTFGSYLGEYDDIPLGGGVFTAIGNTATALLAVFAVFPIVYAFGLEPKAGPQLTFITLVNVFPQMPGGRFWAIAFFVGFFLAAFLGGIAITEVTVTTIKEEIGLGRTGTVLVVSAVIWLIGLPSAYSKSVFNIMDFLFGNFGLPVATLLIILTVGWKIGPEKIRVIALNHNSDVHIGQWWEPLTQYVVPLAMIAIVASFVITHIGVSVVKTVGGVALMIIIPVAAVLVMGAIRRRDETGMLLFGEGDD